MSTYLRLDTLSSKTYIIYSCSSGIGTYSLNLIKGYLKNDNDIEEICNVVTRQYKNILNIYEPISIEAECKQCDYILHALFWALRGENLLEILETISDKNLKILLNALSTIKTYQEPNATKADNLAQEYRNKIIKETKVSENQKNAWKIIRFSSEISHLVAINWNSIIEELNKWETELKQFINSPKAISNQSKQVPPAKNQMPISKNTNQETPLSTKVAVQDKDLWTHETLADKMGWPPAKLHRKLHKIKESPYKEQLKSMFTSDGGAFYATRLDDFKDLVQQHAESNAHKPQITIKNATQKNKVPQKPSSDKKWTMEVLAHKLGYSTPELRKIITKLKNSAHNQQMKDMFTSDGEFFYEKYFTDFNHLINQVSSDSIPMPQQSGTNITDIPSITQKTHKKDPKINGKSPTQSVIRPDTLWSMEKLANELGIDTKEFIQRKSKLLDMLSKKSSRHYNSVKKWFVQNENDVFFIPNHFEQLQKLLPYCFSELWQIKDLAKILNFSDSARFNAKKNLLMKTMPEIANCFIGERSWQLFIATQENIERMKESFTTKQPSSQISEDIQAKIQPTEFTIDGKIWWTQKKLASELGKTIKSVSNFISCLRKNQQTKVETASWFTYINKYACFDSAHIDELRNLFDPYKSWLDAEYLARELNVSKEYFMHKKAILAQRNPEMNGWFGGNKNPRLNPKHLDDLRKLFYPFPEDEFLSTESLATKLGLPNRKRFVIKKCFLLKKLKENDSQLCDSVKSWFVSDGRYLPVEHFEKLKNLFTQYKLIKPDNVQQTEQKTGDSVNERPTNNTENPTNGDLPGNIPTGTKGEQNPLISVQPMLFQAKFNKQTLNFVSPDYKIYLCDSFALDNCATTIAGMYSLIDSIPQTPIYNGEYHNKTPYELPGTNPFVFDIYIDIHNNENILVNDTPLNQFLYLFNLAKSRGFIIRTHIPAHACIDGGILAIHGTPGYRIMNKYATMDTLIGTQKQPYKEIYLSNINNQNFQSINETEIQKLSAEQCLQCNFCDWILTNQGTFMSKNK